MNEARGSVETIEGTTGFVTTLSMSED